MTFLSLRCAPTSSSDAQHRNPRHVARRLQRLGPPPCPANVTNLGLWGAENPRFVTPEAGEGGGSDALAAEGAGPGRGRGALGGVRRGDLEDRHEQSTSRSPSASG